MTGDEKERESGLTRSAEPSEFNMYSVVTNEHKMDVNSSTIDEELPAHQPAERGQVCFSGWLDNAKIANIVEHWDCRILDGPQALWVGRGSKGNHEFSTLYSAAQVCCPRRSL